MGRFPAQAVWIMSRYQLGRLCENAIAGDQLHFAFIYLATAFGYFLFPLTAEFKGLFKIKTLQQFLSKEGSDLAWKFESLLHNMFYFRTHADIITEYPKAYKRVFSAEGLMSLVGWIDFPAPS